MFADKLTPQIGPTRCLPMIFVAAARLWQMAAPLSAAPDLKINKIQPRQMLTAFTQLPKKPQLDLESF
jgi:hypothetical protein